MAHSSEAGLPSVLEERAHPTNASSLPAGRLIDRLADTLRSETKLLTDLTAAMQRQRAAVATDDLDGLDESVFATHRVLATLGEARRRRRGLAQALGETDDLSLSALASFFNGNPPARVKVAVERLSEAAQALQQEVDVNRRVLRCAMEANESYVRSLCGIASPAPVSYSNATGAADPACGGNLIDQRV